MPEYSVGYGGVSPSARIATAGLWHWICDAV